MLAWHFYHIYAILRRTDLTLFRLSLREFPHWLMTPSRFIKIKLSFEVPIVGDACVPHFQKTGSDEVDRSNLLCT
jgi:hypothetical protein